MKKLKTILLAVAALLALPAVSSCGGLYDYVENTKLETEYANHDFVSEGIAEVDLKIVIDGDTAHFWPKGTTRNVIKIRFIGVDTPESTGKVEAWGKKASAFTSEKINSAKHIVISSNFLTYGPAALDSTLTRYMGFVWCAYVDNPTLSDYKLINLWLVQECYSTSKGMADSYMSKPFYDCDLQAQTTGKRIWGETDPDFDPTPSYVETDIQQINEDHENWVDAYVVIEGVVSRKMKYDAYIQESFSVGDDLTQMYGIFLFAGYKAYNSIFKVGNRIRVYGLVAEYMGNIQLTDISYNPLFPTDHDMAVLSTGNVVEPIKLKPNEVRDEKYLNVLIEVENVFGTSGYGGSSTTESNAFTVECESKTEATQTVQLRIPEEIAIYDRTDPTKVVTDVSYFVGDDAFSIIGVGSIFVSETTQIATYQIKLCTSSDFVFLE